MIMTNTVETWITNWFGVIGSATPAFKQYAMSVLLAQANYFNQAWRLGLPDPITANIVTEIRASPRTNGLTGTIIINGRYSWTIADQNVEMFADQRFDQRSLQNWDETEKLLKKGNLLTTNTALALAYHGLTKISINPTVL